MRSARMSSSAGRLRQVVAMPSLTHEEFFVSSILERAMRYIINFSNDSSCAAPGPRRNTKFRRTDSQWRNQNTAISLKPTRTKEKN